MITNEQFLKAIFSESYIYAHVTSFTYDPNAIPQDEHLKSWAGGYYKDVYLIPNSNQFYTVSLFSPDENNKSRRRKANFSATYVIGLDDVKEKLSIEAVSRLPPPSMILKSSVYSEQWLYILNVPETNRSRVDNLHDGLISNGLAPDGKDPGQKGVTRYLRLPEGVNTKLKRIEENFDIAPRCEITGWNPERRYTLEELALPFAVDLDAVRREGRIDGAAAISDHPLLHIPDVITVKEIRSRGRFDITCPWVQEHTDNDDSGSAVFTNGDGSIGFKCHHGACEQRTGRDLLQLIEIRSPGFKAHFGDWKVQREFAKVSSVSFMDELMPAPNFIDERPVEPYVVASLDDMAGALRRERPTSNEARQLAQQILHIVEELPQIDKLHWHDTVCDLMNWNKADFRNILKDLRQQWYSESKTNFDFYDTMVFVKELNQFYDWKSRIFFNPDAFQNSFSHLDPECKKIALNDGRVVKVEKLDYAPKEPRIFQYNGINYGNTWYEDDTSAGATGDASNWLNHWTAMGWDEHRQHMLQWMAYTILHPEKKINHMLLLGSGEGSGKDYLLYPLIKAMGDNGMTIAGEELGSDFNDYLLSTKYLHINEAELGNKNDAMAISNKLKPLASAPPDTLRVNQKGIKQIKIRNIINSTMGTNSQLPVRLNGPSRRFFAVWSDLNTRDEYDNMKPEWMTYWDERWNWMRHQGGDDACIWHLRNHVDLKSFNPGAPPPMTEFLRDIRDASKTPMQQTVEAFIINRVGAFKSDLVTTVDASNTLRAGELTPDSAALMYCDSRIFTPNKVGSVMKELPHCIRMRASRGKVSQRLWLVRNVDKYKTLTMTQLFNEYEKQLKIGPVPLEIVK